MLNKVIHRRLCQSTAIIAGTLISAQIIDTHKLLADDFTVNTPSAVTNGGNVLNGNDSLTITNTGSITTVGVDTVNGTGNGNTISNFGSLYISGNNAHVIDLDNFSRITNSGTINTLGNDSYGIYFRDNGAATNSGSITTNGDYATGIYTHYDGTVINSGSIQTAGGDSFGIYAVNGNTITNSGSIFTAGNGAEGIQAYNNNVIFNTGTITTDGVDSDGIDSGSNNSITNTGSVFTTGASSSGIELGSNNTIINSGLTSTTGYYARGIDGYSNNRITNSGSIITTNSKSFGIWLFDTNTISNTGKIITTGATAHGIQVRDNNVVINSGLISTTGAGANAILFNQNSNSLTLNPGSVLIGGLNFVQATNTLGVGNGLSIANTFAGNLPSTINSNGAPFAVNGLQVAVVDPTNLAAQDELLVDLTGGISGTVQNRLGALRNGGVSGVTSNPRPMNIGGTSKTGALVEDPRRQGWAQAFGSYRLQREHGPAVGSDIRMGGLVSGFDGLTGNGTRLGVFLGGSTGNVDAEFDSQETDVDSLFGGFYASTLKGNTAIDFAMTVGYSNYERKRRVANNTATTGLQTARADYEGWFVSPELTLTRPLWVGAQRFEKSLTLRYAGLLLDGFTETGAAAPLTLNDRDIHVLLARTQLTMPVEHHGADGSLRESALYIGLEGRANVGDKDVSGALLGQNINFNPGGNDAVAGVFAGLNFERTSAGGTTFFASAEGQVETGGGRQASGKAGVKFRF